MGLAGELSTIGLAEVFQNVGFNGHTGVLTLEQGDEKARIAFENGRVRAVRVEGSPIDYLDLARRWELASPEVLEQAAAANRRRTLKAYLLAHGELDEERFDAAVAAAIEEEMLPLFGWKAAHFAFKEGELPPRVFDREQMNCALALDPTGVAMEAARRLDEWETIQAWVPSDGDVLVHEPGADSGDAELPASAAALRPLFDGTRNMARVIEQARMSKYEVRRTAAAMVEAGVLAPASAERVRELGLQASAAGKVRLAVQRLEAALVLDPEDLQTRVDLVRLYQRAGQREDAAREQVRLAELQEERGDLEGALESIERATLLAPDDLDLLERTLRLHERRGETALACKVGRRLADALVAREMYEDALPLYERLLDRGGPPALREALARCLLRLEEPGRAAAQLLHLAEAAHERGDEATAKRYYKEILGFDPENRSALERLDAIESGRERARRTRRKRMRVLLAAVAIAALACFQLVREATAFGALEDTQRAVVDALARSNGAEARAASMARYARCARTHPWTRAAASAADLAGALLERELARLDRSVAWAEREGVNLDVRAALERNGEQLRRLDAIGWPDGVRETWETARDGLWPRIFALTPPAGKPAAAGR